MELAEIIGLIILVAVVLLLVTIVVRRGIIMRAGGFDVSWRLRPGTDDRGWLLGQARYRGSRLSVYRSLSPLPAAALTLDRATLALDAIRQPMGAEAELLPPGVVIVPGSSAGVPIELALSVDALTGLRSWVESRPPGSRTPGRGVARRDTREPGSR